MTVPSPTSRWEYLGDGATTVFQYTNKIFTDDELKVFLDTVAQTLGADYTVTGAGVPTGGNVVFAAAPAAAAKIVILRGVANTQEVELVEGDDEPSELIEGALDRRAIVDQQQDEMIARAIVQPEGEQLVNMTLPDIATRALKFLSFDAAGNLVPAAGTSADLTPVSTFMNTLLAAVDAAAARALLAALENVVTTRGDIVRGSATGVAERLAKGAANRFLAADANDVGYFGGTLAKTVDYTVLVADHGKLILVDATAGAATITLPAAATAGDGFEVAVKKTDATANAVTVDGDAAETIDGAATRVISEQYQIEAYECDGVGWHIAVEKPPDGLVLISSAVAANDAAVEFTTGIDGRHDAYAIEVSGVQPVTDGADLLLEVSENGGGAWKQGASDYASVSQDIKNNSTSLGGLEASANIPIAYIAAGVGAGSAAAETISGTIKFARPSVAGINKLFHWTGAGETNQLSPGDMRAFIGGGSYRGTTNAIDSFRLRFSTGNINAGRFTLYGMRFA